MIPFSKKLASESLSLKRVAVETLQINLGKLCNQACSHCHVEAGPLRTEIMAKETVLRILKVLKNTSTISNVDLTGGAPELNPSFRLLVREISKENIKVIDRCNLSVLFEKGQEDLAEFLREMQVTIVASLPCYSRTNVDKQRGGGVFDKSILALKKLNALGYGKDPNAQLNLVYNPLGAFLPPDQTKLELDYKRELKELFGIEFNSLFTITNMPIKRFENYLQKQGQLQAYEELLFQNFNFHAAQKVMCKNLLSISWDGKIYDCDFNQMLEMPCKENPNIFGIDDFNEVTNEINFANHCYGCTAGTGSSCGGKLV